MPIAPFGQGGGANLVAQVGMTPTGGTGTGIPPAAATADAAPPGYIGGIEGLTPAMIAQMVALGTLSEEQAEALRTKLRGQEVMDRGMQGGRNVRGGYVADNPLAMGGKLLRDYKASTDIKGADKAMERIRGEQKDTRSQIADMLGGLFKEPGAESGTEDAGVLAEATGLTAGLAAGTPGAPMKGPAGLPAGADPNIKLNTAPTGVLGGGGGPGSHFQGPTRGGEVQGEPPFQMHPGGEGGPQRQGVNPMQGPTRGGGGQGPMPFQMHPGSSVGDALNGKAGKEESLMAMIQQLLGGR